MLRLVYLFVIAAAVRRDRSFSLVQEDRGSKTTCQYTVERGRPEPRDGTFRRTHWKKVVTYYKDQDFLQCRALCDALPKCVAFIRRASDDVGYLGMSMKSLRAADDDPTKLLEVPNDVVVGDCWLLETGKLAKYKLIEKITSRITAKGKYDHPFRTLHYEQKTSFYHSMKDEKVTFAKRDCSCEYRYLGLVPSPVTSQSNEYKVLKECEGEYRYIRREYVKVGFEAVYQRTDGEKFIYLCPNATKNADGILTREWYCFDKDDPVFLKEKAKQAGKSMKGIKSFLLGGPLIEDLATCLGQKLPRQGAALPPLDLPLGPEDKDGEPTALTYPRMKPMVLGTAVEGTSYEVENLKIGASQGFFSCAAGKKESEDLKKDFFLKTSKCMLSYKSRKLAWVHWMNEGGIRQNAIVGMLAGLVRGVFSKIFQHYGRSYISIIWRALALWEKLEKAIGLINYIQDGVSSTGHPMEQGEKYACAELMVDHIKSAGGIMPKVSQTLAMKPDVVKDDFVRSALKSTQTENPAKSLEDVRQYVVEKLKAAVENEERTNDGNIIASIDEHLKLDSTLATGSVAQVLRAWVKPEASSRVRDLCDKGQPTCAVVLKVVFDENEKKYQDDWEAIQFLGNDLLKAIHESIEGGGWASLLAKVKLNEQDREKMRHAVSAGYDTWQAVRQGLGAVMDEFDLRIEDLNAKAGRAAVKTFDADVKLKKELGIDDITFDVPKVLMTKSRYIMLQSFAKGDTLTSYHASISGQSDKLKEWRRNIYPSIMGLYGYLMVERGFFQGDPHPGNWYWEDTSKTLTLIDWGLADDFSGGLARAGKLYLDANGKPPLKGKKVYTQEDVDQTIAEHKCQVAKFYQKMADYRRKELLCQGFTVKDSAKNGLGDMVLVPSPSATVILDGTEHQLHTKFFARNLSLTKALGDSFFATPSYGVGDKKPFVLQRRRSPTCFMKDGEEVCGHGWELSQIDGEGGTTYLPSKICVSESCVKTSYAADDVDEEACKKTCKTVDCIKNCQKFTSPPPAKLDSLEIRPISLKECKQLPFREKAYADGAASLGFSTENMNPVVLSLFAALFTNDLLDLKARQENIKLNDPKEPGTSLPDYSAVMLRSLAVFLGMIQDMVQENQPPFVSVMITEYIVDTAADEMFLYWRIFAKRFLKDTNKNQCRVE